MRGAGYAVFACALAMGAFWLGAQADHALGVGPAIAAAQDDGTPTVADRAGTINGNTVGEVLVNGDIVIRMRTSAGGFSAPERAQIIAQRMEEWLSGRYSPHDLAVRRGGGDAAELRASGNLLVDVNPSEANALGSTPMGLANAWRSNIQMALGVEPAPGTPLVGDGSETPAAGDVQQREQPAAGDGQQREQPAESYGNKVVPIISVGDQTAIGAARVNGPDSKLDDVVACTQLETSFRDFVEIDIYVPVRTRGGLDRVQQVGVTGLGDLRL
ncbi:MAG: hypothetical protein ACOCZ7_00600 [Armatimonadota bacterium]